VRDGLAYTGTRRRYTGETDRLLTERCSQQSIRGSKWDYVRAETDGEKIRAEERRGEQRRARGENNTLVTEVGDGLNICRTVLKFWGSPVVTICTASLTFSNSPFCPHSCVYVFCMDLRTNSHYYPIQY